MQELSTGLFVAIAGAALMGAMAFRQLTATLIKLNDQLQESIDERRTSESERDTLQGRVAELETQLNALKIRLESQSAEIERLRTHLDECDRLVALLRDNAQNLKAVALA